MHRRPSRRPFDFEYLCLWLLGICCAVLLALSAVYLSLLALLTYSLLA